MTLLPVSKLPKVLIHLNLQLLTLYYLLLSISTFYFYYQYYSIYFTILVCGILCVGLGFLFKTLVPPKNEDRSEFCVTIINCKPGFPLRIAYYYTKEYPFPPDYWWQRKNGSFVYRTEGNEKKSLLKKFFRRLRSTD